MPLDHADILIGKLAIGRSYVSRGDALQIAGVLDSSARTGRRETFSAAAVRLGYLQPDRAEELLAVLERGTLICRGSCNGQYRLATLSPDQTVACQRCRGPLYVSREPLPPTPAAVPEQDGKDSGSTFINLDMPVVPESPPAEGPEVDSEDDEGDEDMPAEAGQTFLDLELDMPDDGGGGFPPPPAAVVPAAGGDPVGDRLSTPSPLAGPRRRSPRSSATPSSCEMATMPALPNNPPALPATPMPRPEADAVLNRSRGGEGIFDIDGETTYQMDANPGIQFEPFRIGDLEVLAPIGKGGMGAVFRGRKAGELLAIKVLHQQAEQNREVLARFAREVRLTSALDHPNIVRVYETGIIPGGDFAGQPYFTMDYIQGRDLIEWASEHPRSPADCAGMVAQVALAMDYAHGRGIVHRDLKPQNVLVEHESDRPLICDFGLARYRADMQQLTRTGDIMGTPSYMPPEQALGNRKKIGPPTDVYALGAICYYLLTGRPPFSGPSAFATIRKVIREPPRPPSALNPKIPQALEAVVLKALAKEPVDRFHTCGDLAKALVA